MTGPRVVARLVAMVFVLVTTTGQARAHAVPALADEHRIGISRDGVHFTDNLDAPLFDPAIRWVPGDRRTARVYVRNQAADGGDLTVSVGRRNTDGLVGSGWLSVSARAGSSPWHSVSDAGRDKLVKLADVPPGSVVPVDLRVAFGYGAPNGTMVLASQIGLSIRLSETVGGGHVGTLPNTGSPFPSWLPVLALLLLSSGVLLTSRATVRRPRRRVPHLPEPPS